MSNLKLAKGTQGVQHYNSYFNHRAVAEFIAAGGIGEKLHKMLVEKAANSRTHWLEGNIISMLS
jgi:hypothetical protein